MISLEQCTTLDELFDLWREVHRINYRENYSKEIKTLAEEYLYDFFCFDGIIDQETYISSPVKVLFVSNESNVESDKSKKKYADRREDFKAFYRDKIDPLRGKLLKRTTRLYEQIIDLNPLDSDEYKFACDFAFLNLNKRGGLKKIENHIEEYCKTYKNFIIREFDIINPDVIIWRSPKTYANKEIRESLNIECTDDYWISCYLKANRTLIPVIGTYHTSARISNEKRFGSLRDSLLKLKAMPEFRGYSWVQNAQWK